MRSNFAAASVSRCSLESATTASPRLAHTNENRSSSTHNMIAIYSNALELILLVIAAVAEAFLAYAVFQSNPKSASNRIFALLSLVTLLWLLANYATNHIEHIA